MTKQQSLEKQLGKYSKQELISMIGKILFMADPFNTYNILNAVIRDVDNDIRIAASNRAGVLINEIITEQEEITRLIAPYAGMHIGKVPKKVLKQLDAHNERIKKLDAERNRAMKKAGYPLD